MAQILFESTLDRRRHKITDIPSISPVSLAGKFPYYFIGNFSQQKMQILQMQFCLSHNTQAACTIVVYGLVVLLLFLEAATDTWY